MTPRDFVDEHQWDANDWADSYVVLDGQLVMFAACPNCGRIVCTCDEDAPEAFRNYRPVRHVRDDRS